jgi:hypothetical protein
MLTMQVWRPWACAVTIFHLQTAWSMGQGWILPTACSWSAPPQLSWGRNPWRGRLSSVGVHEPSHDPDEPAHHHQQPADPRLDPCTRATDLSFPEGVKRVERCGGVESGEGRTRDGADGDVDGGDGGEGARGWRYQCSPPPLSTLVLAIWPSDLGMARVHCWAWIHPHVSYCYCTYSTVQDIYGTGKRPGVAILFGRSICSTVR